MADGEDGREVEQWATAGELQLVAVSSDKHRLMALLIRSPPLLRLHTDDIATPLLLTTVTMVLVDVVMVGGPVLIELVGMEDVAVAGGVLTLVVLEVVVVTGVW